MKKVFLLSALLAMLICGCEDKGEENSVRVFADSSLALALNDVVEAYNAENPANIEIVSGSTASLFGRIEDGARCDIFIPSSKEQINSLIKDEFLKEENVIPILTNDVVLIKNFESDTTVKSFDTVPQAKNIALAEESEPIGLFSREVFINLNVFKEVLSLKTSVYKDSVEVAQAVAEGKNEVGVCFETDALNFADKIQIITLAPKDSLNSEAIYSIAVLNTEEGLEPSEDVTAFAEYLDTPEAADIFNDYDFGIYIN